MSDIGCQANFNLLPLEIILIISNYHSFLNKINIRSLNREYRDLIPLMIIKQIILNEKIKKIIVRFNLPLIREICVPFGLLVEWNIALQHLTNGNKKISYNKTIKYIKRWLKVFNIINKQQKLSILSVNAAIRWRIGQRRN